MQLQLRDTLTEADSHRHISNTFTLPQGATRLDIDFEYAPKRAGRSANLLTLSLFDTQGERGTAHRGKPEQHVTISTTETTPGYTGGPLPPGEWNVMVNTNYIIPDSTVTYEINITAGFDDDGAAPAVSWSPGSTHPRAPGWYRGDLHGHTVHSDGSWDVDGLIGFARDHQLDFVTLTDHNTVSALDQMASQSTDDLLTMGGFELTTFDGHALALGIRDLIEWRVQSGQRTMSDIRQEIEATAGLFAIAHPMAPGEPVCNGCHWGHSDMMPGEAQIVEVWNEHWDSISNNEAAVQLWYQWLNQGHRLYATVGTDIHGAPGRPLEFGFNVIYAEALSEKAILDGIRRGHLYLSSGPELTFTGTSSSGQSAMIGDSLPGADCLLKLQWAGCRETDVVRLIVDGEVQTESGTGVAGEQSWQTSGVHWYVIEIRDQQGNMRALTNPIFVG